jgi:hypothetical protein
MLVTPNQVRVKEQSTVSSVRNSHFLRFFPTGRMPCNEDIVTASVRYIAEQGNRTGSMVLYSPGDNELNDCHQHASAETSMQQPSDILRAADARDFIIQDLRLNSGKDLTGQYDVVNHDMSDRMNMATCDANGSNCMPYSCDFDKYVELDNYAIATLEVTGSHWYLDVSILSPSSSSFRQVVDNRLTHMVPSIRLIQQDERSGFPYQNSIDPLENRLAMYLNAKDCALDWVDYAARTAFQNKKKVVFFLLHATFYTNSGNEAMSNNGLGDFYGGGNLFSNTSALGIPPVSTPYKPFFDKLYETSLLYPTLMFQVVHSDSHRFSSVRLHSDLDNLKTELRSHHNVMIHQTEGYSRALTMFSRFTVDEGSFQPITLKQEWSQAAFDETPYGHVLVGYELAA